MLDVSVDTPRHRNGHRPSRRRTLQDRARGLLVDRGRRGSRRPSCKESNRSAPQEPASPVVAPRLPSALVLNQRAESSQRTGFKEDSFVQKHERCHLVDAGRLSYLGRFRDAGNEAGKAAAGARDAVAGGNRRADRTGGEKQDLAVGIGRAGCAATSSVGIEVSAEFPAGRRGEAGTHAGGVASGQLGIDRPTDSFSLLIANPGVVSAPLAVPLLFLTNAVPALICGLVWITHAEVTEIVGPCLRRIGLPPRSN